MDHAAEIRGEIRVFGPAAIEDYHAHLVRLDRASRFPGLDDHGIDAHCLSLVTSEAIFVGVFVDGGLRAGAQIVPDRCARAAQAAITVEHGYEGRELERALTARVIEEARRRRLYDMTILTPEGTEIVRPVELAIAV